jgi:hypothetical protein
VLPFCCPLEFIALIGAVPNPCLDFVDVDLLQARELPRTGGRWWRNASQRHLGAGAGSGDALQQRSCIVTVIPGHNPRRHQLPE